MFAGGDGVGDDFQIHRMGAPGIMQTGGNAWLPNVSANQVGPLLDIPDWYKFRGTTSNESLCLVADTIVGTTLSTDCTSSDTTLNVGDTSNFQSAGYAIIESELIQYTGKTGTTLTGCTRGRYGTVAVNHYSADPVYQGLWFTIINGGALFAGYTKPA
jgi:hypothetical protein